MNKIAFLLVCGLLAGGLLCSSIRAQQTDAPLTSQELVKLVYQLPQHPEQRDAVIEEIRRRGLGFELTEGMRGLVATKSGNDALLRRTLEEAARRRANPAAAALPPPAESEQLLEQARKVSLTATAMRKPCHRARSCSSPSLFSRAEISSFEKSLRKPTR